MSVPKMVARMVAINPAAKSMPASDKMPGLTAIIKDMVKKVLRPADNSVATEVLCSSNLKKRFNN
jgi:hypothetical protein